MKRAFFFLLLLFVLASCSTLRTSQQTVTVRDTVFLHFADTTHVVHISDTTLVTEREVIHERILTHYDPQTGLPSTQQIVRDISRQRDSIYSHLLDSLRSVIMLDASASHADSLRADTRISSGDAATPPVNVFAKYFAIATAIFLVIFIVMRYIAPRV